MAGEAYLKVAAANIRRAILEKQQEIQQLNNMMQQKRGDIEHQINDLNQEITRHEAMAGEAKNNDFVRAENLRQAQQVRVDIDHKRQEINKVHDDLRRQISNLENEVNDLMNSAKDFESRV